MGKNFINADGRRWRFFLAAQFIVSVLAFWVYAPGLSNYWVFDDKAVVHSLPPVDVLDVLSGSAGISGLSGGVFGRPLAMASFALEFQVFGKDFAVSKTINLLLHVFCGLLVAITSLRLFRLASYSYPGVIAAIVSSLWILSPLLVSTVLYSTQRMAILACISMLLCVNLYLSFRKKYVSTGGGWIYLSLAVSFVVSGVFFKENALVVLLVILVMEALWFRSPSSECLGERVLFRGYLAVLLVLAFAAAFYLYWSWSWIAGGFEARPFDLQQRLLTEARVLWSYVGQFFFPNAQVMGIYHDDYVVSQNLTDPVSTAASLFAWLMVVVCAFAALINASASRLYFGAAWFLAGHAVESTFLPLEIYFEHRNYFPSIGLALLIGVIVGELVLRWRAVTLPLFAWCCVPIVALAFTTSSLVQIWSSERLLKLHMLAGHPDSYRANLDVSYLVASSGGVESALDYSSVAYGLGAENREDETVRQLSLHCLGDASLSDQFYVARVDEFLVSGIGNAQALNKFISLVQDGRCNSLDLERVSSSFYNNMSRSSDVSPVSVDIANLLAMFDNHLGRYDFALGYSEEALFISRNHVRSLLMALHFATLTNAHERAAQLYNALERLNDTGGLNKRDQETFRLYKRDQSAS